MPDNKRILRIRPVPATTHEGRPDEFNAATPVHLYTSHENQPHGKLSVQVPGKGDRLIEIRSNAEGDLLLEFTE